MSTRFTYVMITVAALVPLTGSAAAQSRRGLGVPIVAVHSSEPVSLETSDDLQTPFHPSRVLVRFRGESAARVVPTASPLAAIRQFRADPNVLYAELDYLVSIDATTPTDPMWSQQWDMVKIAAPQAWDVQTSAADVVVAVIDTGIDFAHPDLRANLWTGPSGEHGYSCLNGTCRTGGLDDQGHGTHVAGTIGAAANNSIGMAGINWNVQLLALKFLTSGGNGYLSDAVAAFQKVAELIRAGVNVRVTNNSWGGGGYSQALADAMLEVESLGVVNVCAAGNSARNADLSPSYPAAYDNSGIVSVLASDRNDAGAAFTNYGLASVDIAAPGVSTLSTVPTGPCALCDPSGYKLLSGTSMASPHVAGAIAALLQRYPALDTLFARDAILHPGSYDILRDDLAGRTSSGGRLNVAKLLTNPFNLAPSRNRAPILTVPSSLHTSSGTPVVLTAAAVDPDGDSVRGTLSPTVNSAHSSDMVAWALKQIFPTPTGSTASFTAPRVARTAMIRYVASTADGRGGSAIGGTDVVVSTGSVGAPPSGSLSISPTSGPVGMTATISYPLTDPERQVVGWELSVSGRDLASHWCCFTGSTNVVFNQAGVYRVGVDAIDGELQQTGARQTAIVVVGSAAGTPPVAAISLDTLSGPIPLTVNVSSQSYDPAGGRVTTSIRGDCSGSETATCTFQTPGVYSITGLAQGKNGLTDWIWTTVIAHPPTTSADGPAVAVISPADGATVNRRSTVAMLAQVSAGSSPVNRVDMYVDSTLLCTSVTAPYECLWNVPSAPRTYRLQAVAVDSTGKVGRSPIVNVSAK